MASMVGYNETLVSPPSVKTFDYRMECTCSAKASGVLLVEASRFDDENHRLLGTRCLRVACSDLP